MYIYMIKFISSTVYVRPQPAYGDIIYHKRDPKGPVKLIKWVKIAHSFLQSVSNQFHFIFLNLPM